MKKLFVVLLIIIIPLFVFSCCSYAQDENEQESESPFGFTVVEQVQEDLYGYGTISIVREKNTDVLYLYKTGDYCGFTAFLKPDGTPMTYDEYKEIKYDY